MNSTSTTFATPFESNYEYCLSKLTLRMGKFLTALQNIDLNDTASICEELTNFKLFFRNIKPDEFMFKLANRRLNDSDANYWIDCYHHVENNYKNHLMQ